jgi:PTH1 family peptidyl-tRNA hydrolase
MPYPAQLLANGCMAGAFAFVGGGPRPGADETSGRPAGTPVRLIVGLGNPGDRYRNTRHNAGFLVVERLALRHGLRFRKSREGETCRLGTVVLLKPLTFMNASGRAVQAAAGAARATPGQILLIHDDLDLPLGRLRFRLGGGAGGQKGVKDTIARIGADFWRLKLGISRPPEGWQVENWVLSRFREEEASLVDAVVEAAVDAVELLLRSEFETAMNSVNGVDLAAAADSA